MANSFDWSERSSPRPVHIPVHPQVLPPSAEVDWCQRRLGVGPEIVILEPPGLRAALHILARKVAGLSEPARGAYMAGDSLLAESPESS